MWCSIQMALITLSVSCRLLFAMWRQGVSVKLCDDHIREFASRCVKISDTTIITHGLSNFDHTQSYVFMSNHRSLMDIPILNCVIPQSLRMIAKAELFRIPFFGEAMRKSGVVAINRSNKKQAIAQLEDAKKRLQEGISIWVSPEGTRSQTKEMGPFKKGGFHVAMSLGVPIVPVWLDGTEKILSKHHFGARRHQTIHVYFGKPVPTTGADLNSLMQTVRNHISSTTEPV